MILFGSAGNCKALNSSILTWWPSGTSEMLVYIGSTSTGFDIYTTQDSLNIMLYSVEYNYHDWGLYLFMEGSNVESVKKQYQMIIDKGNSILISWVNPNASRMWGGVGANVYVKGDELGFSYNEDYFNEFGEVIGYQTAKGYDKASSENSEVHKLVINWLNDRYRSVYG